MKSRISNAPNPGLTAVKWNTVRTGVLENKTPLKWKKQGRLSSTEEETSVSERQESGLTNNSLQWTRGNVFILWDGAVIRESHRFARLGCFSTLENFAQLCL